MTDGSQAAWAIVVARTGPTAKTRLRSVLSPAERARLALAMLADVLAACRAGPVAGSVAVVEGPAGQAVAERYGAHCEPDPGRGMNAAVLAGLTAATRRGATTAIVLPGDLPLASPADLRTLLEAVAERPRVVVVAPDRAGQGTNALLLRPPDVIRPSFGEGSCSRHLELARAAGAGALCVPRPGLALDLDRPADLLDPRVQAYLGATAAWS